MNHKPNLLLIRALTRLQPRLQELLDDQWPRIRDQMHLLLQQLLKAADDDIDLYIDELLDIGRQTPAEPVFREILRSVSEADQSPEITRSVRILDPINQQEIDITDGLPTDRTIEAHREDLLSAVQDLASHLNEPIQLSSPKNLTDTERRINVWIGDNASPQCYKLLINQPYTLNFRIGQPVAESLVDGPGSIIPDDDIPQAGLPTRWRIAAQNIEFTPIMADTTVSLKKRETGNVWLARFDLTIPKQGDSSTFQIQITPHAIQDARLDIVIFAHQEIYRQFTVTLQVDDPSSATEETAGQPANITDDTCFAPASQLDFPNIHEWTTPSGRLRIGVLGNTAMVEGETDRQGIDTDVAWHGSPAKVANLIDNVRQSADAFRARFGASDTDYLNDIDPNDLTERLANWSPDYNEWSSPDNKVDEAHQAHWDEVSESPELRRLAYDGYRLYEAFFPADSELRRYLSFCPSGHRLDIAWRDTGGQQWIPHVPWGLMYRQAPQAGQPIFAEMFLGQYFRIGYFPYRSVGGKDLGSLAETNQLHFLYWGEQPGDPTGIEARWQRQRWQDWEKQCFVPTTLPDPDAKQALIKQLEAPDPSPATLLYLFCQCSASGSSELLLRFANSRQATDILDRTELGISRLVDKPLVFANACSTSEADPYRANELESIFFQRGCRAYLGTEIKVPIQLASRFADIFFHFFYRKLDPAPMAAGEAVAQTRRFLWQHYRNLGGIFYTYINQYELFMASDSELQALRHPTTEDPAP